MRVLHLVHAYYPAIGGSEYLVQQVSEYLAGQGDDVTVFTTFASNSSLFTGSHHAAMPADRAKETIAGVAVQRFPVVNRWAKLLYINQYLQYRLRLPGNGFWRMLYYGPIAPAMKKAVETFETDIIMAAPFPLNHMAYPAQNRGNAPVVLVGCAHIADRHGFHNPRIRHLVRQADGYVALTPFEKEFLVNQWGIDKKRVEVIGVGIDILPSSNQDHLIRTQTGWQENEPIIAFVGQHGLHKGIDTLIKAMPRVWEKIPHARLLIAGGTTPFTPRFKELAKLVDQSGNDPGISREDSLVRRNKKVNRVYFMDNLDTQQKYNVLDACEIFASPSGFESFGITILEAWMKKKPVVACQVPATANLVDEGQSGILVPYKNSAALAEVLVKLLLDPELKSHLGETGFEKLKKNYTKKIIGEKYRHFYDKIMYLKR